MPRFVRPAWLAVNADGRATPTALGPRSRDGYVSGRLTLRTAAGAVSDEIRFDAGGRDDSGRARLSLTIPAGWDIELGGGEWTTDQPLRIIARPTESDR